MLMNALYVICGSVDASREHFSLLGSFRAFKTGITSLPVNNSN